LQKFKKNAKKKRKQKPTKSERKKS
jgi:hypothetical protein